MFQTTKIKNAPNQDWRYLPEIFGRQKGYVSENLPRKYGLKNDTNLPTHVRILSHSHWMNMQTWRRLKPQRTWRLPAWWCSANPVLLVAQRPLIPPDFLQGTNWTNLSHARWCPTSSKLVSKPHQPWIYQLYSGTHYSYGSYEAT